MTRELTMYDADQNSQFPPGGDAYAAYADGHDGDQPNYPYIVKAFPAAHHLSIAVFAADNADCLDVEASAAAPGDVAAWYARQKARGVARPCIYASVLAMEAGIVPVIAALPGVAREGVRLWSAHYGAGEHICGPSTCRLVSIGMDGTQWADRVGDLAADQSLLLPDFFGTPAHPVPAWQEAMVKALPLVKEGDTGQAVRTVQGLCAARGHGIKVDGVFGPATRRAVVALQTGKVPADGTVGPLTYPVLMGIA